MGQDIYSQEKINFIKVAHGLSYIGTTLETYTVSGLDRLHQNIYKRLANEQPCQQRCSHSFGPNFGRWCTTCKKWKKEFEFVYRDKTRFLNIDWKSLTSWTWPDGPEHIAEVFLAQGWARNIAKVDIKDLSTAISLWNNCTIYNIQLNTLKKLREIRNSCYGHNPLLTVKNDRLTTIFDVFGVLFRDTDIKDFIDINQCLQELKNIKEKNHIDDSVRDRLRSLESKTEKMEKKIKTLDELLVYLRKPIKESKPSYLRRVKCKVPSWMVFILVIYSVLYFRIHREDQKSEGCLSEIYTVPFTPELQLEGYLHDAEKIVGRQWLVLELKSKLLRLDSKKRGILATADMGYGKSSFVSHLLCSRENSNLKDVIISYHLCIFDVLSTKNPALFIRRLVGMTAERIPEFGSIVSMQPNTSIIFDKQLCEQDPVGCFDQGFVFPIRNLKTGFHEKKIIVIDALDECSDSFGGQNRIVHLLRSRAHELPDWINLFITSRNSSEIQLSKDIVHMHLSADDHRNFEDIKKYIQLKTDITSFVSHLKHIFDIKSNTLLNEQLLNISGGNFLFLTHAFEYWSSVNRSISDDDVPDGLDRIYELNFERIFGTDENNFRQARTVLEVICASFHQLTETELSDILGIRNLTYVSTISVRKTLNQLSVFVKSDHRVLMFTHISIRNWLLSKDNTKFSVSVENGAVVLSEYLLHELRIGTHAFNYTQLVLQGCRAKCKNIEEKYLAITQYKTKEIVETNTLHAIVSAVDSSKGIDLIAKHYKNIDHRNEKNLTASCIAAYNGHLKSLQRLLDLGADINVTVEYNIPEHFLYDYAELFIDHYKVNHFPGYKLLHFASQFGHVSVVEYLHLKQKMQMNVMNKMGYTPFHLACEFGKTDVVKYFISKEGIIDIARCLYLASKNQHESVVKIVVSLNSSDYQCVSETEASASANSLKYIDETDDYVITSDQLVRPLDVWWKLRQDSPLHVSVRNGNLEIFTLISSALPMYLDCTDSGGLTPFLASVVYQKTDIFKVIAKDRYLDVCSGQSGLLERLRKTLRETISNDTIICDKGMGLSHMLALSGTKEMIEYTVENVTELEFRKNDDIFGISPLHLAACSGNIFFLRVAHGQGVDFDITSKNGSTPYHSAVSCRSYIGLYALYVLSKHKLPFKNDNHKMSLGLYLVKDAKSSSLNCYADYERNAVDICILQLILNSSVNFVTSRDSMNRNIFHYSLRNGQYHLTLYLLNVRPELSSALLLQRDKDGITPVEYAINSLAELRNKILRIMWYHRNVPI